MTTIRTLGVIDAGVQKLAMSETVTAAGISQVQAVMQTDTLLVTLFVSSAAADLVVTVYGFTDDDTNRKVPLFIFPTISSPTANLVLKRAAVTTARVLIEASYAGAASFEIYVRGIQAGLSDTKIIGAENLRMSQKDITTGAPQVLIASALSDRSGVLVKNWSATGNIYVGASSLEATVADGYPLGPKDAISIDIQAGVAIYAVAETSTVDVRLVEVGG